MGSYFLTNDLSQGRIGTTRRLFEEKGHLQSINTQLGAYQLIYFPKINLKEDKHVFENGQDKLVSVGTFIYRGQFGFNALKLIYDDIKDADEFTSLLRETKGHFNLILYLNGELMVVTDRVGAYHSFIGRSKDSIYVSNSYYAILDVMEEAKLRKQGILEFAFSNAQYGPHTMVEEIDFLGFGKVHQFRDDGKIITKEYHIEEDPPSVYGLEEHYENVRKYLSFLADTHLAVSCDLSAGFDTRLVCAVLKDLKIPHTYNTNINSWDPTDLEFAKTIAEGEGRKLVVYKKDQDRLSYEQLIQHSLTCMELSRDAFQAAYSHVFFDNKTRDFGIVLGGYGGELYRDVKYHGIESIDYLIRSKYTDHGIAQMFSERDLKDYQSNLAKKMRNFLGQEKNTLTKIDCERIYYHFRMMYWGGSRITQFNSYAYRYHPLFDYRLIRPLFFVDEEEKNDGKFQMMMIERFDHQLATYPSNYGYNFLWDENTLRRQKPSIFVRGLKKLGRTLNPKKARSQEVEGEDRSLWRSFLSEDLLIHRIFDDLEINDELKAVGRLYTIEYFLERYKSKLAELN